MGNSESEEKLSLDIKYMFFWRSDPDPFSPFQNSTWTPYDEGDNKFLEKHFQLYLLNKNPEVSLGDPPKYKIDFKNWLQINVNETWRQRPIKRDIPSNVKNIIRFNRFDAETLHENQPKIKMIENNVQKLLTKKEGYIQKTFRIIPNKEVEILIPKNLDFLKSELLKFKDFCNLLNNEIEILSKLSIFQNKQHPCKYDDELKTIKESNFYETILRMYTMEGFLYKEVNKILRNSHSNDFHQICYYYTALLASVAFYSKSTLPLMKEENIIKEGEKSLMLYRGGGISENEILEYKKSGNS